MGTPHNRNCWRKRILDNNERQAPKRNQRSKEDDNQKPPIVMWEGLNDGSKISGYQIHRQSRYCSKKHEDETEFHTEQANDPDQRPGAADAEYETRASSPGSLHLACSAFSNPRIVEVSAADCTKPNLVTPPTFSSPQLLATRGAALN
jgi:hypothetical protein